MGVAVPSFEPTSFGVPANRFDLGTRGTPAEPTLRRDLVELRHALHWARRKQGSLEQSVRLLEQMIEWSAFVLLTAEELKSPQAEVVRRFWLSLSAGGRFPLPKVQRKDETVRFSWSRPRAFLDLEIWPDGACEWFFSIEAADGTRHVEGTSDEREPVPTDLIADRVRQHFALEAAR